MSFTLPPSVTPARSTRPRAVLAGLAFALLAGCANGPVGSVGRDAFVTESSSGGLTGMRSASESSDCFEERARFLPLSTFSRDGAASAFVYRLRVSDRWFEEVRIAPEGSGSRAEWRLAPGLDSRWQAQFERDRLAPLRRCLGL